MVEAPLKTKNAYRTLSLAQDTVDILKQQKKKVGGCPWMFPRATGGPMSPDSVLHTLHLVAAASISLAPSHRDRAHSLRGSSSPCGTRYAGPAQGNIVVVVRHAGGLLRWADPGHLRPCDWGRSVPSGTDCGKYPLLQSLILSEMLPSFSLKFPVWVKTKSKK